MLVVVLVVEKEEERATRPERMLVWVFWKRIQRRRREWLDQHPE